MIQVIYVFLALLIGGGLVLFGIGGNATGGLGDALGIGGNSSSSGSPEFSSEIDSAQQKLASDPTNTKALLNVARYSYLNGQQKLGTNDQGQPVLTEEAVADFETAINAWERYLKANKGKPDASVATLIFRAYSNVALSSTNPATIQRRLEGAQEAAAVVAAERPGPNSYYDLAATAYFAGDTKAGDKAAKQALKDVQGGSRSQLESQLKAAKQQGEVLQKQLKKQQGNESGAFTNPLGDLGGGSTTPSGG